LADQQTFLNSLNSYELDALIWYWPFWAREDQLAPLGDWTSWLLLGGRGAGKTRAGAEWVRYRANLTSGPEASRQIALVGETLGAVRQVMVEGPSGILAVSPTSERPRFYASRNLLVWPNGARAYMFSAERPQSLRGPQFDAAWCDELAKWRHDQTTWDMLQFGLRLGSKPQQVLTTTPRPTALLKALLKDDQCLVTRSSTSANKANLAPSFLRDILKRYEGTRLGRQELEAELLDDRQAGLWNVDLLDRQRCQSAPTLEHVIVAVDPPVGSGPRADGCGVIILGRGKDGLAYIIGDQSSQGLSPRAWARKVAQAYDEYNADLLVAEVNQGGELIRELVLREAPDIRFRAVRARRGKLVRAEPIVALYERGFVFHVGNFEKLEEEMCRYDGHGASPDRMDALVWGLTEMLLRRPTAQPGVRSF
jgi:predicted phage terminase large subunit-like protein